MGGPLVMLEAQVAPVAMVQEATVELEEALHARQEVMEAQGLIQEALVTLEAQVTPELQVTLDLQVTQVLHQLLLAKRSQVGQEVMEGQEVPEAQQVMVVLGDHKGQAVTLETLVLLAPSMQQEAQQVTHKAPRVPRLAAERGFHAFTTLTFLVTMAMQ